MSEDNGASPDGDRAVMPSAPSPAVSAVPVFIPSARQMHMRWTTDNGLVLFEFPSDMSLQDVDDVCALLDLTMAGIRRRASAMSARQGQDPKGLGAEPASAVPKADAQGDQA